jgi:hypothetical protein
MSIVPLIFWGIAGPLFPMLSYAIADILLRKQETTIIERGTEYNDNYDEKKIYVRCGLFFFFLYLIAGIIYKAIVL